MFGDVIKAKKEQAWRWESGSRPLEIVWYKKTGRGGDRGERKGEGGRVWKGERGNKETRREGEVGRGEKKERKERKSFEKEREWKLARRVKGRKSKYHSLMKECPLSKEYQPPSFDPTFCTGSKSNEYPPWSKLCMTNGAYLWSLRSKASTAMHI